MTLVQRILAFITAIGTDVKKITTSTAIGLKDTEFVQDGNLKDGNGADVIGMDGLPVPLYGLKVGIDLDDAHFYQNGTTTVDSISVPKISVKPEILGTAAISSFNAKLSADVQMPVTNQWYDAVSLSLATGTYLIAALGTQSRNATTAETIYARVTDGTNTFMSTQGYHASAVGAGCSLGMRL